jgi:outer membrane immunogenic protein
MKLKLLFAAAAAFAATPAMAQDDYGSDGADGGVGAFTGPRIEVHAGWDRTGVNIFDVRDFGGRTQIGGSQSDNGIFFGGEVGFDAEMGSLVIGAYGGVDFSDNDENFVAQNVTIKANRNIYAGARLGIVLAPRVMVYGRGGYSRGRLHQEFRAGANTASFAGSRNPDGWHFGGGVEVNAGMVYFRGDFTHTTYDDHDLGNDLELHFSRNQLTAGVGIRF